MPSKKKKKKNPIDICAVELTDAGARFLQLTAWAIQKLTSYFWAWRPWYWLDSFLMRFGTDCKKKKKDHKYVSHKYVGTRTWQSVAAGGRWPTSNMTNITAICRWVNIYGILLCSTDAEMSQQRDTLASQISQKLI